MRLTILSCLLHITIISYSQKLVSTKVGDGILLKIPAKFINMTDQDRMAKIATSRIPLAMFSTLDQQVTLGVNDNVMQWTKNDTKTVYGFYKASVQALFDEINFIQDTVQMINGREFIVFEFTSVIRDDNIFSSGKPSRNYTYIQYTSYDDQVLLFNFGCLARLKFEWEDTAKEIMQSVLIK